MGIRLLAIALTFAASTGIAFGQGFPGKPVTLIVPWPPGGGTDIVMRALAEATAKHLGQPIVVENRPGAGGTLGAVAMLNARPDGYTITQISLPVLRVPHINKTPYDPIADLTYVIGVTGYTFGVAVRADAPWKTFNELVAYAKANPDKVAFGTPGANTSLHITMEEIAWKQGIRWTHVPYKGDAENMAALLGGHINASAAATAWAPHVTAGKMRVLVTWGERRTKSWPDVPTLKELGYEIVSNSPYGIGGPKGMDPQVVKVLHDAFRKGMEDPAHVAMIERYDWELWYRSTEDYARWARETFVAEKATMERLKAQSK
jgi:tripartite-type tricarboxylate transporter receptor subunit TctC